MTCTYKFSLLLENGAQLLLNEEIEDQLGATALSLMKDESNTNLWRFEAYFETRPDDSKIQNILQAFAGEQDKIHRKTYPPTIEELPDTDWISHVQSGLSPVSAGRFLVYGSHDREQHYYRPYAIQIDAGQAFGTAHHGTTRGCLIAIEHVLKQRDYHNVLDIGTGSGVLALAVAKMSCQSSIIATDIDKTSLRVARFNMRINQASPFIKTIHASGLKHSDLQHQKPYDLIIANILAGPLKKMAREISYAAAGHSTLILSGLLVKQAQSVIATYRSFGFAKKKHFVNDEWSTLVMTRGA